MLEAYGNIWDLAPDFDAVVITTNGFVKKNGEAVMGKGIAKEAAQRYPELPKLLGKAIQTFGNVVWAINFSEDGSEPWIITFPVKPIVGPNGEPGWRVSADLDLIKTSFIYLTGMSPNEDIVGVINNINRHPDVRFHISNVILPRPGCGNGKLEWEDVKPLAEQYLDDRFTVVTFHE